MKLLVDPIGVHRINDTLAEKKERDAARRKTRRQPSQVVRMERQAKNLKRHVRDFYTSDTYYKALTQAIKKANEILPEADRIPRWTPYQLRHTAVTELTYENDGNADVARAVAGQKTLQTTQGYNHADVRIAIDQAKKRSEKKPKPE